MVWSVFQEMVGMWELLAVGISVPIVGTPRSARYVAAVSSKQTVEVTWIVSTFGLVNEILRISVGLRELLYTLYT